MAEQITLKMEAEELRTWMKDKRTKKVLAFLVEKQQELAADLLAGNYRVPNQTLEDLGAWMGIDDCPCGRLGKTFTISGRVPKAEPRGCSDTRLVPEAA